MIVKATSEELKQDDLRKSDDIILTITHYKNRVSYMIHNNTKGYSKELSRNEIIIQIGKE